MNVRKFFIKQGFIYLLLFTFFAFHLYAQERDAKEVIGKTEIKQEEIKSPEVKAEEKKEIRTKAEGKEEEEFLEEEVVITGTRTPRYVKDVPVRTEVITSKAIELKGATNLYEALEGASNVRVEKQCSFCNFSIVRIQGLGPDHTQVLIDGQPIYSGLASVYGLQQLGVVNMDRIEIVKGAGSALYGSGSIAGAINIITKRPTKEPYANVLLEYGEYGTHNFAFDTSLKKERFGLVLTAQKNGSDAIDMSGENGVKHDGISDSVKRNTLNIGSKFIVDRIFGDDEIIVAGRTTYENRVGGVLEDDTYENPFTEGTESIITKRYETEFTYKKKFKYENEINFTSAYTFHDRNATNDAFLGDYMAVHNELPPLDIMRPYMAKEHLLSLNLNYLHPVSFFGRHGLLIGFQYSYNELNESGKYEVVDENDPNYGADYTSTSNKHANEIGAYLQDEYAILNNLEIVAGARVDYHKSEDSFRGSGKVAPEGFEPVKYEETSVNPRFAFKYQPVRSLTLRSSVGTGFRVPYGFSEDLHLCSGSPRVWKGDDLVPERSLAWNMSIDANITKKFILMANVFYTKLYNKIGFVEASEEAKSRGYTYEWQNIDDAYVAGAEFGSKFILTKFLDLEANFTLNSGKYDHIREDWKGTEYENISRNISRFPMYTGGLTLVLTHSNFTLALTGDYQGPMYIDYFKDEEEPTKIKKTEPNFILSAKLSYEIARIFDIYVGWKNLTNYIQPERHLDDAAFIYSPLTGRIFYGGIKAKL